MKLPLERHSVEGLFDPDTINEDQVCLSKDVSELEEIYEEVKQKYDETLKKLKDREDTSIGWSVEDFIMRAFEMESSDEDWKEPKEYYDDLSIKDAKKYLKKYDPDKFEDALYKMIWKHDASIGITWDTIDYYLDEYCLRK